MADSKNVIDGIFERKCNICLKKGITCIAGVFCSTCNEYQCNNCSKCHSLFDFMKDHNIMDASISPSQRGTISHKKIKLDSLYMCDIHNKSLEFYCKDEKRLICTTCAIVGHRKCNDVVEIVNIAKENKCEELRNKLKTVVSGTEEIVESLEKGMLLVSTDAQQIQEKLKNLKETLVQMFDDFAENVTKTAISYQDRILTEWTTKQRECEIRIADLKKMLDTIDDIVQNGTASEKFIIERSMSDVINQQSNDALTVCNDLKVLNVECNFEEHFEKFQKNLMSSLISDEFEIKYTVPTKTNLELITSIDLKQTDDDIREPFLTGLDFLPDGRLVAVDNKNGKCSIYNENLKLQTSYKLPYDHPRGIVAVSNEDIAITSGKRLKIDFLHVSNTNEITLKRTCKVKSLCFSIRMKDDENFVVGCYDDNIPVRLVSVSGEERLFDFELPSKKYSLGKSFCTFMRDQDKLVMSNSDEDTIYIYDIKTGEKIVVKDDLIKRPCDVAVGPCDHVFVCSEETNAIVEITPRGRVLSSYKLSMQYPRFLAVSTDGRRLSVSNCDVGVRKLTIYKIL